MVGETDPMILTLPGVIIKPD